MHMSAQASAKNSKPAARANAAAAKKLKLEEKQAAGEFKRLVEEAKNGKNLDLRDVLLITYLGRPTRKRRPTNAPGFQAKEPENLEAICCAFIK